VGPPPGSRLHLPISIAGARLLQARPRLAGSQASATKGETLCKSAQKVVHRFWRPLDKASHPCHTQTPFNTQSEGKMTVTANLAELSEKHRLLERKIEEELARPSADDLQISQLKKEKLRIKDEILKLQSTTQH
jgi:hypothetical protein